MKILKKLKKHGLFGIIALMPKWMQKRKKAKILSAKIKQAKLNSEECYFVKIVHNNRMLLNLNDAGISRELFFTGTHEPESTQQYMRELKEGMNIIELGANIGYYALIAARAIGKDGHIIAFEPSPINMENLRLNITLNQLDSMIETHNMGIGNICGTMPFNIVNKGNMSSFYQRKEDGVVKQLESVNVQVTTLDVFTDTHPQKIDYIRMDVEGYEWEILQGMQKLLNSENAPEGFFIEVHSTLLNENGHSCKEFLDKLKDFGYDVTVARWRGKSEFTVNSINEILNHELCETGYWEAFFRK